MRIVVVEDGAKIRRGIIQLIQKINPEYKIVGEAANGADGLKIITDLKPDLVIADIRMPELNGLEMLQQLKSQGLKHKTVIISAYSDFSFAQQAISIGVSDYLLKPVTAEKLEKALAAIGRELDEEELQRESSRLLTVKHIFQDLLMGRTGKIKELPQYLNPDNGFDGAAPFVLVGAYTGNKSYDQVTLQQTFNLILSEIREFKFLIMDNEVSGLTILFVACRTDFSKLELYLERTLLDAVHQYDFPNLVMGWIAVEAPQEVYTKLQQLREMLKWALILGKNVMITQSEIARLIPKPPSYPDELEKQAIQAVSHKNFKGLQETGNEFLGWWQKDQYPPEQIIAGFVRFISSVTNGIKEIDPELFKQVKQQEILQQVLNAVTMDQLEVVLEEISSRLTAVEPARNFNYSLTVVKALKLIVENYQSGITREEIAARLHITPEYLSMLFYKEVGQSFTAYLKNYRIGKAKELLMNTGLKIYEVAERVGYPDPKYFCRVFKEVTGVSAGEFLKRNL
ncbi:MAG TPA: response regulator [Bacillota bacterium]|nr:response regulator [Bacillota bacterium]